MRLFPLLTLTRIKFILIAAEKKRYLEVEIPPPKAQKQLSSPSYFMTLISSVHNSGRHLWRNSEGSYMLLLSLSLDIYFCFCFLLFLFTGRGILCRLYNGSTLREWQKNLLYPAWFGIGNSGSFIGPLTPFLRRSSGENFILFLHL
ncbi:hypothetical protein CEXT_2751 [Caerostris extrusa]|uniref:Uncharacterized protein n=1 Tax=Caerostris extrusa TaxID=172846 RepID=A0AAV4QXZ5_CAEEX|nr:hypothetical protein CEXT_2751 [Caerostris extrusa]